MHGYRLLNFIELILMRIRARKWNWWHSSETTLSENKPWWTPMALPTIIIKSIMAKVWLQTWHLWCKVLTDHSNWPLGTGNSQLLNIDEKKNDTCHICALGKLTMILANDSGISLHFHQANDVRRAIDLNKFLVVLALNLRQHSLQPRRRN